MVLVTQFEEIDGILEENLATCCCMIWGKKSNL